MMEILALLSLLSCFGLWYGRNLFSPSLSPSLFIQPTLRDLLGGFILYFGTQLVLPSLLTAAVPEKGQSPFLFFTLLSLPCALFFLLLHVRKMEGYAKVFFGRVRASFFFKALTLYLLALSPLLILAALLRSMVLFGGFEPHEQLALTFLASFAHDPTMVIFALIDIVIIAPLGEELLFRGLLQGFCLRYLSANQAVVLTSLIFAAFHGSSLQGVSNIEILLPLFCFSLLLGRLYGASATLWPSIFLHSIFNFCSSLIFLELG